MTSVRCGDISVHDLSSDGGELAEQWASCDEALYFSGTSLEDFCDPPSQYQQSLNCIVSCKDAGGDRIILPFIRTRHSHKFTVGERLLGNVSVNSLHLVNPWLSHGAGTKRLADMLLHILRAEDVDLLTLGEIPVNSDLCLALQQVSLPGRSLMLGRKNGMHWLIDLPSNFEEYLAILSSSSRQSTRRKMRKLSTNFTVTTETITKPCQVNRFLDEGEKISRKTYQWNVGQRLQNNPETRIRYRRLAERNKLRCYLMFLNGEPAAFLRGTIEETIYHYETPGFDPKFSSTSVGTVILMTALKDLIENTSCSIFDFGTGGDHTGYKSTYGTRHIACNSYYLLALNRPRSLVILCFEYFLTRIKNITDKVLPKGELRHKLKRRLRQYQ